MNQSIEPLIRGEPPPDDAVLVVRGGPLTAQKIVEHAARQRAVFTYRGEPMIAISVDLAIEGWSLERILRERMWSHGRGTPRRPSVSCVRAAMNWSPRARRRTTAWSCPRPARRQRSPCSIILRAYAGQRVQAAQEVIMSGNPIEIDTRAIRSNSVSLRCPLRC